MKIFLDTANLEQVRQALNYGFLDGVTTNPTLASKEGIPYQKRVQQICEIVDGPVSAECITETYTGLIQEAFAISKWAKNVVVKIPVTWEGMKATKVLASEGIKVNVTLCFSPVQALIAAKAGAYFVSPFVGRLDDIGQNGMDVVKDIVTIYKNYGYKTQVITASIRHVDHVITASKVGSDIATMPYSVYEKLVKHSLTDKGLEIFKNDYSKIPKS